MTSEFLMARQPIMDRGGKVHAYELLYRLASGPLTGPLDLDAERQSILNAMVEIGLARLVGEKPAFFNLSPEMLVSVCTNLLPPGRVVLELLENTVLDEATGKRIAELKRMGYTIAYDDFTFQPHQLEFVGRVDIIKVDVMDTPWQLIERAMPKLKASGACILAEKVEDREVHDRCMKAGFDLFQGYYFSRPETLASKGVDTRKRAVLNLLSALNQPDATTDQLESAIALDPTLAARLLRLVNSAGFGVSRKVGSIRVAIQMLGIERLQAFATILAASGATGKDIRALGDLGLIRARMCERVARQLGYSDVHKHFTIGLLSVLDALLDMPMSGIVSELALSDDVAAALLDPTGTGEGCVALGLVTAYERGGWACLSDHRLNQGELSAAYSDAVAVTAALD